MKKSFLIVFLTIAQMLIGQEITLNHNHNSTIIDQNGNFTCSGGGVAWARVFVLEDFGVTGQFTINSGSFGIEFGNSATGDGVIVNVYEIDSGFPNTFDESSILGSSNMIDIPTNTNNTVFSFDFPNPIVVSPNVEMILVEVRLGGQAQLVFMGGTSTSSDFSWWNPLNHQSCQGQPNTYQTTVDLNRPNLNYYITVTGDNLLGVDQIDDLDFSISPNPVYNTLNIQQSELHEIVKTQVFDINGKVVLEDDATKTLNVSSFSSGLYFLRLETRHGFATKKFVKR